MANELLDKRDKLNEEIQNTLLSELRVVSEKYLRAYGERDGLKILAEELCTKIAPTIGEPESNNQWTNIVLHLKKISG